ncbi:response regulator transcription factor [Bifidobacterium callitrichos]|uniref:Response regulator transcription factor n=1 Tax=Bifidobacterium callitrichos TaxID=762209 RepID=A0A5M9ZA35_9BIFI|nr:LuxR C-terminal-related transcriptional regulator [Bifidobacterium callitrichos]KAA8815373.1 response regulator transcription factor [Bifidobacterium callitrichos]
MNHENPVEDSGKETASASAVTDSLLRIGILDNDALALDSITRMLESQSRRLHRKVTIWSTTSPAYAIQECRMTGNWQGKTDILLIDMALNGVTGPQIASLILSRSPHTVIIGMTSYNLDTYRQAAAHAGIVTLLDKATFGQGLLDTIKKIADEQQTAAETAPTSNTRNHVTKPLSDIERTIVALSLGALSSKQIGARMGITADTVSSHRRNIKRKLGVATWLEAMDYCRSMHIV